MTDTEKLPSFSELGLAAPILKAITAVGYEDPSPIQAASIPPLLEGRDLLGQAQTGTGKTAAFSLPIIQQLYLNKVSGKKREIRALILTPTRELAIQINDSLNDYTQYTGIRHCVIYGGVKQKAQTDELKTGIDILVATPGRLLDLINQGFINLDSIRHFVLDEADRMLDMGFIHDIKRILPLLPKQRQTLFFSATMSPEIAELADSILQNPEKAMEMGKAGQRKVQEKYLMTNFTQNLDQLIAELKE